MVFGTCYISKIITNVNITNVNQITLVGSISTGTVVEDCYNFGNLTTTTYNAPTMVLHCDDNTVLINRLCNFGNLTYTGSSTGSGIIAGICITGNTGYGTITNCLNAGTILSNVANYGGYGISQSVANISKCYNIGNIDMVSTAVNCGQIAGVTNTGENNFYDSTLYTGAYGYYNGTAKTTEELTDGSNLFSDTANWVYEAGYYPRINNWLKNDSRVLTALAA
jgi:hypothetical protein